MPRLCDVYKGMHKWGRAGMNVATFQSHFTIVNGLLDAGADVNRADNVSYAPPHETSPLLLALFLFSLVFCRRMLETLGLSVSIFVITV